MIHKLLLVVFHGIDGTIPQNALKRPQKVISSRLLVTAQEQSVDEPDVVFKSLAKG